MVALNFNSQFVGKVETGCKRQTIRATRKRPIEQGDTLQLYTGMRTKHCRLVGVARCTQVMQIEMVYRPSWHVAKINLNNARLTNGRAEMLAIADGFDSMSAFWNWFFPDEKNGFFKGQLIKWEPLNFCLGNNSGIAL